MNITPEISIVMPIYNCGTFLPAAVASIKKQTFSKFECLLCDSTNDGSSYFLHDLAQKDHRFILVREKNASLPESLQNGIEKSSAPLIARMDADDISLPQRLQVQFEAMKQRPETVLLGTAFQYMDKHGNLGRVKLLPQEPKMPTELLWGCPFSHPSVMLRRDAVLRAGGYRSYFKKAEDYDLWLRLLDQGRLENLKNVLLYYRIHGNNSVIQHAQATRDYAIKAQALHFLGNSGTDDIEGKSVEDVLSSLDPSIQAGILSRMLACHAHLIGDEIEDKEGAVWLRRATSIPFDGKKKAFAIWHIRCAKRYVSSHPSRAIFHAMQAMNIDISMILKMLASFVKEVFQRFYIQ